VTSRRNFILHMPLGLATFTSAARLLAKSPDTSAAAPISPVRDIHVGSPITIPDNFGDTWATALADDGNLYTPSDDTLCFGIPEFFTREQVKLFSTDFGRFVKQLTPAQKKVWQFVPIGFNRIEGNDPTRLRGTTVNRMHDYTVQDGYRAMLDDPTKGSPGGFNWKSSGCAFIDGALYWFIHRDGQVQEIGSKHATDRAIVRNSSLIKSIDYGKSWTRPLKDNYEWPMFPGASFPTPYFIDYAGTRVPPHGGDRYVYATSNNGFYDNGDRLFLGRVLRTRIGLLNKDDWEFFAGGDGSLDANWVRDSSDAKPILERPGRFGKTGAAYLPYRGRYLIIGWYYPGGGAFAKGASATTVWDFYEAPTPWGSWTQIKSHTWHPQGYYTPLVCPKFQTADKVYVVTAGDYLNWWEYYRLTLVPISLA
jgi:hypothetical protein